jgi:hypothetical protein
VACSVSASSIPSTPFELVGQADVIVRARAEGLSSQPGREGSAPFRTTQVEFRVVAVLKGTLPTNRVTFNGSLTTRDEPNRGAVPYRSVRPSGSGSCFSLEYRQGAEYLLFLKPASHRAYAQPEPDQLTPYWAPTAPSNEQLFGPDDAWEAWVRTQLRGIG